MQEYIDKLNNVTNLNASARLEGTNVYLNIDKNDESLTIILPNKQSFMKFVDRTKLQKDYGVLHGDNNHYNIISEMKERKCNWVLTDNNLNFVQCFNDKDYNPVCKNSKQSFLRDVEHWGVAAKRVSMTDVKLLDDTIVKCLSNKSTYFTQKVFLKDENSFVYLRKEDVKELYPSQLMYLFHKSAKDELSLTIVLNNTWFYE